MFCYAVRLPIKEKPMNSQHQPAQQWGRARVLFAITPATLLFALFLLLTGCNFRMNAQIDGVVFPREDNGDTGGTIPPPPDGQFITTAFGVLFQRTDTPLSFELYPVHEVTGTEQFTGSQPLIELARSYPGTVRLDFALLHHPNGGNNWTLVYNANRILQKIPTRWYEYLQLEIITPTIDQPIAGASHMPLGFQYAIVQTQFLTTVVTGESPPTDLAAWVDAVLASQNANYESINRLLFTVENEGVRRRILFVTGHDSNGSLANPDGSLLCGPNRSGRIYCRIIRWLSGRR
jgi:hypothetical protein